MNIVIDTSAILAYAYGAYMLECARFHDHIIRGRNELFPQ
jgi:hypothetical protein